MHRAISGDLQNEEEMDRAMLEAGEEAIFQVKNIHHHSSMHKTPSNAPQSFFFNQRLNIFALNLIISKA